MALYTIGDTHLSLGSDKPMDVFGGAWEGSVEKGCLFCGRKIPWLSPGISPGG